MNHSSFDGPVSVVVTSISAPNSELQEIASQCKARGYSFYVIGDMPSPANFSLEGCEFYSLQRQRETGFKIAEIIPTRHYSRKNIGYLLAMRNRPAMLLETDDDNMPLADFWDARDALARVPAVAGNGWTNVYQYFTETNIWPRGLPLDAVQRQLPDFEALPETDLHCPIQQGLADEDPDVDAIYRLLLPLPVSFRKDRRLGLARGSWCPFNSQNTAWFPPAYPLLYLPSYCSFRMTDIWRSFVAQRIAWENGWSVLFKGPDVYQRRNEHNLMKDFADEVQGYLHNRTIGARLDALKLEPGVQNLGDNLIRCYEELVGLNLVGKEELPLVKAWVQDVAESNN
ncbi:MAG: STELLO glycosyltransferase family protein [Terracidiphilus sp.]